MRAAHQRQIGPQPPRKGRPGPSSAWTKTGLLARAGIHVNSKPPQATLASACRSSTAMVSRVTVSMGCMPSMA